MSEIDNLIIQQEQLYQICVDINNCCECPNNNGNFSRDCDLTLVTRKIEAEVAKKRKYSFVVTWHADGYCGAFRHEVVAESLDKAKEVWEDYVCKNEDLNYSWEKAKNAVRKHYGGYIEWKEQGLTDKAAGFYKLPFDYYKQKSDHLWD